MPAVGTIPGTNLFPRVRVLRNKQVLQLLWAIEPTLRLPPSQRGGKCYAPSWRDAPYKRAVPPQVKQRARRVLTAALSRVVRATDKLLGKKRLRLDVNFTCAMVWLPLWMGVDQNGWGGVVKI